MAGENVTANFFLIELLQYFQKQGQNISENIQAVLTKSTFELTLEEQGLLSNIVLPSKVNIKKALSDQFVSSGCSFEVWKQQYENCSDSIIGSIAGEIINEIEQQRIAEQEQNMETQTNMSASVTTSTSPRYSSSFTEGIVCDKCGRYNKSIGSFCAYCGERLIINIDDRVGFKQSPIAQAARKYWKAIVVFTVIFIIVIAYTTIFALAYRKPSPSSIAGTYIESSNAQITLRLFSDGSFKTEVGEPYSTTYYLNQSYYDPFIGTGTFMVESRNKITFYWSSGRLAFAAEIDSGGAIWASINNTLATGGVKTIKFERQ